MLGAYALDEDASKDMHLFPAGAISIADDGAQFNRLQMWHLV
jgi:hypothetical protein